MNRRSALSGLVAATAAATAASVGLSQAASADAELIALCEQFDNNERRYLSLFPGGENAIIDDDERSLIAEPMQDEQAALAARIVTYRIGTFAGFLAVARSLGVWDQEIGRPEDHSGVNEMLTAMLVRDARAMS